MQVQSGVGALVTELPNVSQVDRMDDVEQNLANWKQSLMKSIPLYQLTPRNPTAYKWKALFKKCCGQVQSG